MGSPVAKTASAAILPLLAACGLFISCEGRGPKPAQPTDRSRPDRVRVDEVIKVFLAQREALVEAAVVEAQPIRRALPAALAEAKSSLMEADAISLGYQGKDVTPHFVDARGLNPSGALTLTFINKADEQDLRPNDYGLPLIKTTLSELNDAVKQANLARHQFTLNDEEQRSLAAVAATVDRRLSVERAARNLLERLVADRERFPRLQQQFEAARQAQERVVLLATRLELRLADGLLRLARHLGLGNARPLQLAQQWDEEDRLAAAGKGKRRATPEREASASRKKRMEQSQVVRDRLAAILQKVTDEKATSDLLASIAPRQEQYSRLLRALKTYRGIVHAGGWIKLRPSTKLRLGQEHALALALKQRLKAEGYHAGALATRFDAPLLQAIAAYPVPHQLEANGQMTSETWRSLNVPATRRLEAIRINLKRWRESPIGDHPLYVLVNIPDFHVEVWKNHKRLLRRRVIVGKRHGTKCDDETRTRVLAFATPIQSARIRNLDFAPFWNVTREIKEKELDPERGKDPLYYQKHGYEILAEGTRGESVRELPGPANSLGFVKFIFPNRHSVFLHDTPMKSLFARPLRTFSHGCMRVQDPRTLAHVLLLEDGQWDEKRFTRLYEKWSRMDFSSLRTGWDPGAYEELRQEAVALRTLVLLRSPIPLHALYFTVRVDAKSRVHFHTDVYGHDHKLLHPSKPQRCVPEGAVARYRFKTTLPTVEALEKAAKELTPRIRNALSTAEALPKHVAGRHRRLIRKVRALTSFAGRHSNLANAIRDDQANLARQMQQSGDKWKRGLTEQAIRLQRLLNALGAMNREAASICTQIDRVKPKEPATRAASGSNGPSK
jgi:murein L,D-transpeptidase YcbB/YkuD